MSRMLIAITLAGALGTPVAAQDWTYMMRTSDGTTHYWQPGGPGPSGSGYKVFLHRMDLSTPERLDAITAWTLVWHTEVRCSDAAMRRVHLTAYAGQGATGESRSGPWEGEPWGTGEPGSPLDNAARAVCR